MLLFAISLTNWSKKTLYVTGKSLRKVTENENLKIMATLFKYCIMLKYDYDNHEI